MNNADNYTISANTGDEPLVLYTTYSPPERVADAVHPTKADANAAEAAGRDEPPRIWARIRRRDVLVRGVRPCEKGR